MKDKTEIFNKVVEILTDEFELEENSISMDVNLYNELGLDSIDAVDLIIRLQELTGKKIDSQTFREVSTVADIVNAIEQITKS